MENARCKTAFSWASIFSISPKGLSFLSTKITFSMICRLGIMGFKSAYVISYSKKMYGKACVC